MSTPTTSSTTAFSPWRWWRDWLLMSLGAVFVISLLAAHLPPSLKTIVVFPIGVGIACGLALAKCAEIAGTRPERSPRWLQCLSIICLLLAAFTHVYWIVFDRYLDDAREVIAEQTEDRREREEIAAAIAQHGEGVDDAGISALLQPPPPLPTFVDYLAQRMQSERLPRFLTTHPWPSVVFGVEIFIATTLGVWLAVGGRQTGEAQQHQAAASGRGMNDCPNEISETTTS